MPFDSMHDPIETPVVPARTRRGQQAYYSGLSAEEQVARHYVSRGCRVAETRWRGVCGEIDLVVDAGGVTVFVEVKSSRTHARAAESLGPRQIARLMRAGEEYAGGLPSGSLTEMRIDVALVDRTGRIEIIENALMAG